MFWIKKKDKPGGVFAGLSRKQRRQLDAAIIAAKGDPEKPESVQVSIPYLAMYPDGV